MGPAGTEDRVEEVGGPIEHLRMPTESRGAVDIAFHAHQTTDPIDVPTGGRLELRQGNCPEVNTQSPLRTHGS